MLMVPLSKLLASLSNSAISTGYHRPYDKEPRQMSDNVPEDIRIDLQKACALHQRAVSDYEQCTEFSKLMSDILARLEEAGCFRTADKVMTVLLDCNPKIGAHCERATLVGQRTKKLG